MTSAELETWAAENTYWERAADTRWGRYITEIESRTLLAAASSFSQPGVALEIGCEGGRWSRMLSDRGWRVIATDIDAETLSVCQQRNPSIRCVLTDPEDDYFPADEASVDLLLTVEVSPIVNQPWYAAEVARVLKPGGKLVATTHNRMSWRGAAVNIKSAIRKREQFYGTKFSSFQASLFRYGLIVDQAEGCCWAPLGRESDSKLVSVAVALERGLRLNRLTSLSPWIVFSATKR